MNFKEQVLGYLIDTEEDEAAKIILESDFIEIFENIIPTEFDEWDICSFHIQIKGQYLKVLESHYNTEKEIIENILEKFAKTEKKVISHISWLPLPKIYSKISEYNQNDKMKQYLINNDFDNLFRDIKSIFASLSYNIKITEAYFHSNIHVLLKVLGFNIVSEDETNIGRIDSVIELENKIVIIEFKTSNFDTALEQIKQKKYYEKYLIKEKEIYLIGVNCNLIEKNISDWKVEKLD